MRQLLFASALAAMALATPSSADVFTSSLDLGDAALTGFPGPYGTVEIELFSPQDAVITFTADESHNNAYVFGGVAVNVNATAYGVNGPVGVPLNSTFLAGPYTGTGEGSEDSFGVFNLRYDSSGFLNSAQSINLELTNGSGTWASAKDVLKANADGNYAAAQVFACSDPEKFCFGDSSRPLADGFAADPFSTPEPASMLLLGSCLVGVAAAMCKRAKKQ